MLADDSQLAGKLVDRGLFAISVFDDGSRKNRDRLRQIAARENFLLSVIGVFASVGDFLAAACESSAPAGIERMI